MDIININQLYFSYGKTPTLKDINLSIPAGKITIFLGPNGSGKSTLLKLMARLIEPKSGEILFKNKNIFTTPSKALAKELSILVQDPSAPMEFDVFNLVKAGRYPYQTFLNSYSKDDEKSIDKALHITHLQALKYTKLHNLSGGQRQRAFIAMILAQDTEVLLFDEPTNHLDIKHQLEILHLVKKLNSEENRTIIMVLHDINLALRFADELFVLQDGQISAFGSAYDTINADLMWEVFGVKTQIQPSPISDRPMCFFY